MKFSEVATTEKSTKWETAVSRERELYNRVNDIRSPFARDFNRILHCTAYRRLKHKTQVFFAPQNDHICTRIEHVNHVSAVSYTIAKELGLNTELTQAIAIGHDLGHAPFGHAGETYLQEIAMREINNEFWHEKNSLWFVDMLETLPDPLGQDTNLLLTYAVRDGIICHCGEVDDVSLNPREQKIDLYSFNKGEHPMPFTWEGCVVKIADKISYLGRDIEDALSLKILTFPQIRRLKEIQRRYSEGRLREINNTVLMHEFIIDLCENSNPDVGINISRDAYELMVELRNFNYENIYTHPRIETYKRYAKLIIESIYESLWNCYNGDDTIVSLRKHEYLHPILTSVFSDWIEKYSSLRNGQAKNISQNEEVYDFEKESDFKKAAIDFIAGMTDSFAVKVFNELISFQ